MLTPASFPSIGGVERHVDEIAANLASRGYHVVVLAVGLAGQVGLTRLSRRGYTIVGPLGPGLFRVWRRIWSLRHELKEFELAHCHDVAATLGWSLPLRVRLLGRPFFVTFHGHEGLFPIPWYLRALRKLAVWSTEGQICVGAYIAKWYGTRCTYVVYGGVNAEQFSAEPVGHQDEGLLFVGRLDQDTGITELLDAFATLKHQGFERQLVIAGDGPLAPKIRERSEKEKLEVRLLGKTADIQNLIGKASVVVASGYLSILEALSMGRNVLYLAQNPLRLDYVQGLGGGMPNLHVVRSTKELAMKIRELGTRDAGTHDGQHSTEWQRRFSWDDVTEKYLKLWGVIPD